MPGNPMPAAEVVVSANLVRRLLAGQHPDLAHLPIAFLANGWDNAMFRVGHDRIVRLPRRAMAAKILAHEQRWLPLLHRALPLPIPYPERCGHPAHGYPWTWSIVAYIPGEPAADSGVIDFGDITSGDHAADLSVAWMLLPVRWHAAFRDAYQAAGGVAVDNALWARAKGWALNLALVFVAYSADNPQLMTIGRRTLRAVLT